MKTNWFKSKTYGYGWYPNSWQGWLILAIFIISIIANAYRLDFIAHSVSDFLINFIPQTILMVAILLVITIRTSEPTHWRWGGQMLLVYTTFPDNKTAKKISIQLVKERLIACSNINPIESHYIWEGQIMESTEVTAFLKTTTWNFPELKKRLTELHPYERVCIIKVKGTANMDYFNWLKESVK